MSSFRSFSRRQVAPLWVWTALFCHIALWGQELSIRRAIEIEFNGLNVGQYYQLEASEDFEQWQALGPSFRSQGTTQSQLLRGEGGVRFYRVRESAPAPTIAEEMVYQHSTLGALIVGVYEGDLTFGELLRQGDFGLGTFQAVDGELIVLEGQAYRVRVDGVASTVPAETLTPFGVVTFFEPDLEFELNAADSFEALQALIEAELPSPNLPYAIKVTGTFESLTTRSVPAQQTPYPPLGEVVAAQTTFDFASIEGTMVGFRLPSYTSEVNAAGFHFHFLDHARTTGGHVLAVSGSGLRVEVDVCQGLVIDLPGSEPFLSTPLE